MKRLNKISLIASLFVLLMGSANALVAQETGNIKGKVYDAKTGEVLPFVNVLLKDIDPPVGTTTDFDGNYDLKVAAGTYSIEASFVGYTTQTVTDIVVTAGNVTEQNINIEAATEVLDAVEVTTSRVRDNTDIAVLALTRKSVSLSDGISGKDISRRGGADAAAAAKTITGASVVDGKYVYIRGLGDRYSSAQLNGMQLPSTDPYRNSTQLDLIPSNLLDNIVASKSFTPDQPGNFTGGNVNLQTKSFPSKFTLAVSLSSSYNTQANNIDNFLTHGENDVNGLGFSKGSRDIPNTLLENRDLLVSSIYLKARRDEYLAGVVDATAKSLSSEMTPSTKSVPMNQGASFSLGNRFNIGNGQLGVLASLSYRHGYNFYDQGIRQNWELTDRTAETLNIFFDLGDTKGVENKNVGGLANLAYKFGKNKGQKVMFNAVYNHDTDNLTRFQSGSYPAIISGNTAFETRTMQLTERSLQSLQLQGEHTLSSLNNAKIAWGISQVENTQSDPDLRFFANTFKAGENSDDEATYFISPSEYDLPYRFWRDLTDKQQVVKADFTLPFLSDKSSANKIKVGYLASVKNRVFTEDRFQVSTRSNRFEPFNGNPAEFFGANNVGQIGYNPESMSQRYFIGLYYTDETVLANSYTGTENINATYGMVTYDWSKVQITAGVRLEMTDIEVASADTSKAVGKIDQADILPVVNLKYELMNRDGGLNTMYLRGSYTKTLARPNMRELAPFSAFDFIGGFLFTGNPEIDRTLVDNFDLRWEWYPRSGELYAISAYSKQFDNPIIQAFLPEAQNPELIYKNVEEASVQGIEIELRKRLDVIDQSLKNFTLSTNLSLIRSVVDIPEEELEILAEVNPEFGTTRPFQGQSPYLFNASLGYLNEEHKIDALLAFNIFGERLAEINQNGTPDVYEQPRPQLDFNIKKTFGENINVRLGVRNILDSPFKKTMNYKGQEYTFLQYPRGRTISFGLSYNIN